MGLFGKKKKKKTDEEVLADKVEDGDVEVGDFDEDAEEEGITIETVEVSDSDAEIDEAMGDDYGEISIDELNAESDGTEAEVLEPDDDDFTDVAESLNDMGGSAEIIEEAPARKGQTKKPAKGTPVSAEESAQAQKKLDRFSIPIYVVTAVLCVAVVAGIKFGKTTHELLPMSGLIIVGLCFSAFCPIATWEDKVKGRRSGGIMIVAMIAFLSLVGMGGWFYYQAFL